MNRKTKSMIAVATLCATVATAATPVSAMSFKAAPAVALESLADVSREEGLTTVSGNFSAKKITNKKDAKAVIASVASQLGINNVSKELVFVEASDSNEFNTVYTFQQIYKGVKVADGFITLVVDKATNMAEYLSSSIVKLDMDTTPAVSEGMASALLREKYGYGISGSAQLTILKDQDGTYKLAWIAQLPAGASVAGVIVDAQSGEFLSQIDDDNYTSLVTYNYTSTSTNSIANSKNFSIQMQFDYDETYQVGSYLMYDPVRNIRMVMEKSIEAEMDRVCYSYGDNFLNNNPTWFEKNRKSWLDSYTHRKTILQKNDTNKWTIELCDRVTAGTMYQVEQVYDTFYYYYGWKGTDGKNSQLYVEPANVGGMADGDAHASCFGNYIKLGYESRDGVHAYTAAARDIVAHEYTHRISGNKVQWNFSSTEGETGCLNEGYSDILGEYADTHTDWVLGADMYRGVSSWGIKNARDYSITLPSAAGNWCNGQIYKYTNAAEFKEMECHDGSTVLSHAAYLMNRARLSADLARRIWFTSLDYLPKGANKAKFKDARLAVFKAADKVIDAYTTNKATRDSLKMKVVGAFNEVNLHSAGSGAYRRGDVNGDGKWTSTDTNMISNCYNYHNVALTCQQLAAADANCDGTIDASDKNLVTNAVKNNSSAVKTLSQEY